MYSAYVAVGCVKAHYNAKWQRMLIKFSSAIPLAQEYRCFFFHRLNTARWDYIHNYSIYSKLNTFPPLINELSVDFVLKTKRNLHFQQYFHSRCIQTRSDMFKHVPTYWHWVRKSNSSAWNYVSATKYCRSFRGNKRCWISEIASTTAACTSFAYWCGRADSSWECKWEAFIRRPWPRSLALCSNIDSLEGNTIYAIDREIFLCFFFLI